jgi:uncharacterized phage protein (TIGR02218 family)
VSRTLSAGLTSHISGRSHTRCNMLLLTLRDGTEIGITDHDSDLTFDIGTGSVTYDAGTGILTSNVATSCGLDANNYEITGPIGSTVTLDAILGGRFNRARARLFQVNWKSLSDGAIKLLIGTLTDARVEGGKFVFEIRDDFDFFNQVVGRLITNQCDADFGDARCTATPVSVVGTVTAVTDAMRFTVSFTGSYANDYFNKGTVEFLTGALAGTLPIEIEDWTSAGAITLFAPAVENPTIGDTLNVIQGCGKSRADCIARNNITNFRGYPEVPGSDQVLRMPIPGSSAS